MLSSDKVSIKFLRQVNAGYGPATAFVDMQMLGGFSIISSYAEMKMEALSMANGCEVSFAEGAESFGPRWRGRRNGRSPNNF